MPRYPDNEWKASLNCPLRVNKGRCWHRFNQLSRYDFYNWSYPKKGKNYIQYIKRLEWCELKRQIVAIQIYQFDEINQSNSFYNEQIDA